MKIFLIGGTGFLGKYLRQILPAQGHEVTVLVRQGTDTESFGSAFNIVMGNPTQKGDWQKSLDGHDAVINLAGTSIFQRWTTKRKNEILESRVLSTRNVVRALREGGRKDVVLLNASGIGYYGPCGDNIVDEMSPAGNTFLASVAESWESNARQAEQIGIRVVRCRFGIILGRNGGAFPGMEPLFRYWLGGTWGKGEQWFSWIHEVDVGGVISYLLEHKGISGSVNFTAPNPVKNREMTETINLLFNKKIHIEKIPEWFFKIILGEFSEVILQGQRVIPGVLLHNGFVFRFPVLKDAVADLIR